MIWSDCFKLIKVLPGRIVTPRFGTLDFSDPKLPIEKLQVLFEEDFPYLQITPLGMDTLYPVPPRLEVTLHTHSQLETGKPLKKIRNRKR